MLSATLLTLVCRHSRKVWNTAPGGFHGELNLRAMQCVCCVCLRVGRVALIKFSGGFGPLEAVPARVEPA